MIRKHLKEDKVTRVEYLPKGSPDYNAVEECFRREKDDLMIKYYPKFPKPKKRYSQLLQRFKLDITKYQWRNDS
jgi:transposase